MQTAQFDSVKRSKMELFPNEAQEFINSNSSRSDIWVIDVSTPWEYAECHLESAVNINLFSRSFKSRIGRFDKDRTFLLYCKIGRRSKMAQGMMRKMGFSKVYNLIGGTLLWEEEGLPLKSSGKKSIASFCPVSMLVKGVRRTRKFFGRNITPDCCRDIDAKCQCDDLSMEDEKFSKRWQDCCR